MKILHIIKKLRLALKWVKCAFPLKEEFGAFGCNSIIQYPVRIYCPKKVFVDVNVKISSGLHILNAPTENIIIKKYSVLAANCTLVTNSHVSTVTIPQFVLGASHVNDRSADILIDEDVWLGTGVTVMQGVHIGRGCIVGAGSIVTKDLPPYTLAVGNPAKVIKKIFTVDQILAHEKILYSKSERFTRKELEDNEQSYFSEKKTYGTEHGLDDNALNRIYNIKQIFGFEEPY